MGKQDTLRNLLIAGAIFLAVMWIGPYFIPVAPPPSPDIADTPRIATPGVAAPTAAEPAAGTAAAYTAVEAGEALEVEMGALPSMIAEDGPPPYRMHLTVSNVGASIETVRLSDHGKEVNRTDRYELVSPVTLADGTVERSFAVEKINIDGFDVDLGGRRWQIGPVESFSNEKLSSGELIDGQKVSLWIEIQKDGAAELRLTRTYVLPKQSIDAGRHDMWSTLAVESLSPNPHRIVLTDRGAVNVPGSSSRFSAEYLDFGIQGAGGQIAGARKTLANVTEAAGKRLTVFRLSPEAPGERLVWAALDNTYFTATSAPLDADWKTPASYIAEGAARDLDANAETQRDVTFSFVTTPQELPAGGKLEFQTELYLGEKDRAAFKQIDRYVARNYYFQIAAGLSWCTFNWLVELMIWLLNALYFVVRDFGVAIIILVLIVRALLHPITKKGQVNMVRMQQRMSEFAPKMEELKKKFGNDKARLQQETMKLYREHGINPAGQMLTCLPMVIQMPIWVALFYSLSNNILMRHQPLHFTWIKDLTSPDALYRFSSPIHVPIFGWELESFNLLPLLVAVFMYIQQKTIPKPPPSPNMTEQQRAQQEMMQKMMPIMSIMMLLFFYKMPAGLNLYVMFSSLFGWLEQNRIRKHIKEREHEGKLHKPPPGVEPAERKRRLPGWLERLQKAAEEAQKAQRTQRRDKPKRGR